MAGRVAGRTLGCAVAALVFLGACSPPPSKPAAASGIGWRRLGAWSGHGDMQTESFKSESGSLRVRWTARAGAQASGPLRIIVHSAISGRPLAVAVEHHGSGQDTAYVHEDPRDFYVEVESSDVEWSFTVEEGVGIP